MEKFDNKVELQQEISIVSKENLALDELICQGLNGISDLKTELKKRTFKRERKSFINTVNQSISSVNSELIENARPDSIIFKY